MLVSVSNGRAARTRWKKVNLPANDAHQRQTSRSLDRVRIRVPRCQGYGRIVEFAGAEGANQQALQVCVCVSLPARVGSASVSARD